MFLASASLFAPNVLLSFLYRRLVSAIGTTVIVGIYNISYWCVSIPFLARHHVEVHRDDWWIERFESFGFKYSERLTKKVRGIAGAEKSHSECGKILGPNDKPYNAQHIRLSMLVFVNPMVASLPKHAHLFADPGCYQDKDKDGNIIQ